MLIAFAAQNEVLDQKIGNLLVATVALSMVAAPFLFTLNEASFSHGFRVGYRYGKPTR